MKEIQTSIGRQDLTCKQFGLLLLLTAFVTLQSCGPVGSAGGMVGTGSNTTDTFSLCQHLGLSTPLHENGPIQTPPSVQLTPAIQSSAFTGHFPDIEFIPVHVGATETARHPYKSSGDLQDVVYTVPVTMTEVLQFYGEALKKYNWQPLDDPLPLSTSPSKAVDARYTWDDPADLLPWHMGLDIGISGEGKGTWVQLLYYRYPDIGKNLPAYPDAEEINTSCSENFVIQRSQDDSSYKATIRKSYVTDASDEKVVEYYQSLLPRYGWDYKGGSTYRGGMTPVIGLALGADLHITASPAGGRTKVELSESIDRIKVYMTDEPMPK